MIGDVKVDISHDEVGDIKANVIIAVGRQHENLTVGCVVKFAVLGQLFWQSRHVIVMYKS